MVHTDTLKNKRHIYYIEKGFQTRWIIKFCVLVALGSLLTIGLVYWLAQHSTTVTIDRGQVAVRTTVDYLLPLMTQTVLIQLVIMTLATIVMMLFISHKIAGPLYHLKMMFKGLAQGDIAASMRIRKGDQLQIVVDAYNEAVSQLNHKITKLKDTTAALGNKAPSMKDGDVKQHIEELKKILNTFNTV